MDDYSASYDYTTNGMSTEAAGAILVSFGVIWLALIALSIVVGWKIFTKAGQAGWKSIIPIYNLYVLLKIVRRPGWWLLLFFVPLVNFVVAIVLSIDLAKSFGRSTIFGVVGLFLFSLIGMIILAFGKDKYVGPGAQLGEPPAGPASQSEPGNPAAPTTPSAPAAQ